MNSKRIFTVLLAALLCLGMISAPVFAQQTQPNDMESVLRELLDQKGAENKESELSLYCFSPENESKIRIMYTDGFDVPNIEVGDWTTLLNQIISYESAEGENQPAAPEYEMEFSAQDSTAVITRKNGSTVTFDNKTGTVEFSDLNAFMQKSGNGYLFDLLGEAPISKDGQPAYFKKSSNSYMRRGDSVTVDLTTYGIKMYQDEDGFYVPMQTLGDLMLAPLGINLYYNGEAVFIAETGAFETEDGLTPLGELFYRVSPGGLGEDMAEYSYCELCLVLDHYYGLKETHLIEDFDSLFEALGYQQLLKSTNPKISDETLYRLLSIQFDDLESEYLASSPFSGYDLSFADNSGSGFSARNQKELADRYQKAVMQAYPEGIPGYEEVGNTAFITIPEFKGLPTDGTDYYETAPEENAGDTIGLLLYAFHEITREGSPVKNVVMDLSANEGGDTDAGLFAVAFFLGEASVCMTDPLTGAFGMDSYEIDLNLDRQFNETDQLPEDLNLYCLTSPITFAEASLIANAFKNSNRVTMMGQTTGDGNYLTQPLVTAYGTSFRVAGRVRLSVLKNGAFYDMEEGAVPDYPIFDPSALYDRGSLTAFINSLPYGAGR